MCVLWNICSSSDFVYMGKQTWETADMRYNGRQQLSLSSNFSFILGWLPQTACSQKGEWLHFMVLTLFHLYLFFFFLLSFFIKKMNIGNTWPIRNHMYVTPALSSQGFSNHSLTTWFWPISDSQTEEGHVLWNACNHNSGRNFVLFFYCENGLWEFLTWDMESPNAFHFVSLQRDISFNFHNKKVEAKTFEKKNGACLNHLKKIGWGNLREGSLGLSILMSWSSQCSDSQWQEKKWNSLWEKKVYILKIIAFPFWGCKIWQN